MSALLLLVVGVTGVAAYLAGTLVFNFPRVRVATLAGDVLECLGLGAVFYAANLLVGFAAVLAAQRLTKTASPYLLDDLVLVPLSFIEGLALFLWRRR